MGFKAYCSAVKQIAIFICIIVIGMSSPYLKFDCSSVIYANNRAQKTFNWQGYSCAIRKNLKPSRAELSIVQVSLSG